MLLSAVISVDNSIVHSVSLVINNRELVQRDLRGSITVLNHWMFNSSIIIEVGARQRLW